MHIYSFEGFEVEATISTTTSFCLVTSNAAPVGITSDATVGALLITMHNHIVLLTSMAAASARTTTELELDKFITHSVQRLAKHLN
ncbi:hypothetical protein JHK82_035859 [Glycine max]|uniref:Uncharacterized protein n=2 Tax=Glycine subgen. Soja TaxID=1462606 RepID=A0A0R0GUK8_SOYBN|nr:hypothetical protein JHK87_035784 [Glycine soja]KAG4976520.1 hypothetical protein JHK86_035994 [Glycine max]KAG5112590.1 hypothetical protein JHK82_035859 [Glycine max]KAG5129864.1 hypothetical protein JHK84_036261 [Glycine max]KAH1100736.1 hypothetical protein GYH30_035737 [Glycine max]